MKKDNLEKSIHLRLTKDTSHKLEAIGCLIGTKDISKLIRQACEEFILKHKSNLDISAIKLKIISKEKEIELLKTNNSFDELSVALEECSKLYNALSVAKLLLDFKG